MVDQYQTVCIKTSEWLSVFAKDAAGYLDVPVTQVVSVLDETGQGLESPMSSQYWAQLAMNVVTFVASDTHCIANVYKDDKLVEFFGKLRESAIQALL